MTRTTTEILYGVHPLEEALRAGRRTFESIYIRAGRAERRLATIAAAAVRHQIPVQTVDEAHLRRLVGHSGHQGVCARVTSLPVWPPR